MTKDNSLQEIADYIRSETQWTIIGHMIPDGDCIGSVLALSQGLKALGFHTMILLEDPAPEAYAYLEGWHDVIGPDRVSPGSISNIIVLDSADIDRMGESVERLVSNRSKCVNIDHHFTNPRFGDVNYVDPDAAATGEIVFQLLETMGAGINADMANALYAALVMDTGNFKNANTNSRSFRLAARLLELGADVTIARINLFESKDSRELQMIRMVLDTIQYDLSGRLAWAEIPCDFIQSIGADGFHPEGIVNYTLMAKGVEVGILFREIAPDTTKISFRSKDGTDVARLAAEFGGGGHPPAAGARVNFGLQKAKSEVLPYVLQQLGGSQR